MRNTQENLFLVDGLSMQNLVDPGRQETIVYVDRNQKTESGQRIFTRIRVVVRFKSDGATLDMTTRISGRIIEEGNLWIRANPDIGSVELSDKEVQYVKQAVLCLDAKPYTYVQGAHA